MALGLNFFNTPAKIEKLPIQEPLQQAGINAQFQQGMQNYNPDMVEQYAQRKFQRDIVPQIAESFTRGGSGHRGSSAFQGALGAGASDLAGKLANLRYEQGLNQLKIGLTPQNEYLYSAEQPGLAQEGASKFIGSLAEKTPDLIAKGIEAWGNRGKNKKEATSDTTETGTTASENAATTTEQRLNNLTPQYPKTAADLVPQSTGNMAIDAYNNPSLTPFTRQALAKTKLPQTPETAKALENVGKTSSIGSRIGSALGSAATTTATTVPLVLSAVAAGAPAAVAIGGGLLLGAWNLFKSYTGK